MKKALLAVLLMILAMPAYSIKFPECCVICKEGQACGDSCIPKDAVCEVPIDWGCACDYRYIKVIDANKAKCCVHQGGAFGCAGDRILCNDGTASAVCGCLFLLEREESETQFFINGAQSVSRCR